MAAKTKFVKYEIARIEGGGSTPTVDMLDRLARATGKRLEITLAEAS